MLLLGLPCRCCEVLSVYQVAGAVASRCRCPTWYTVKTNIELFFGSVIASRTPTTMAAPAGNQLLSLPPLSPESQARLYPPRPLFDGVTAKFWVAAAPIGKRKAHLV